MFYPEEALRRGGRFYLCWIADSWPSRFASVTQRQLSAQNISSICDDLLDVMMSESGRATKRFSLRLSSQLLRGLVRLYQKKVDVFLSDVCMVNAYVMKRSHKKLFETTAHSVIHKRPRTLENLPRIVIEELEEEEAVEEQIKNAENTVARVEDITLREPTLPENRLVDDGFGELHRDQALQMLVDRSAEMMLVQETSALQHSALDLPLDVSHDKSHDRSRVATLAPHDAAQMERISEHDVSVFGKSVEAPTMLDIEKEIPEISVIPPPDLPAPEPDKPTYTHGSIKRRTERRKTKIEASMIGPLATFAHICINITSNCQPNHARINSAAIIVLQFFVSEVPSVSFYSQVEKTLERTQVEEQSHADKRKNDSQQIVLEELEEEAPPKRRKLRNKLIRDNKTKLSSDYLRARIGNNDLELRCANTKEDKVTNIFVPAHILLHRPTHCGPHVLSRFSSTFTNMFTQNLSKIAAADKDVEEAMLQRTARPSMSHDIPSIPMDISTQNVQLEVPAVHVEVPDTREAIEMADLPTQKILSISQAEKRDSVTEQATKRRRWDSVYYQRQSSLDISAKESNKENLPGAENIIDIDIPSDATKRQSIDIAPADVTRRQSPIDPLTSLLQEAGLADVRDKSADVEPGTVVGDKSKRSEDTETPLGSLDRTRVSLGDSEDTTDSKRFIRDEWGTQGTMFKIYRCARAGAAPVTVQSLVSRGPVIDGHRRVIAARCFTSILKLKQHGFIDVVKDDETNAIKNIVLGARVKVF